ncbi:uncharacterized protein LOC131068221 [Cryptomeria japonica]|uniref:uncharacterized protein LOC131068221 n=1 Tax=Cryptomeria japonica TaxID=3369 RepID=UPI0025ABE1C6|nr:uncharacterized protein LOC131068221 [Cryptomeria japonica]XP_057859400.1 uncharacterized protein LOC131068221 [Cryptomeria japonica]
MPPRAVAIKKPAKMDSDEEFQSRPRRKMSSRMKMKAPVSECSWTKEEDEKLKKTVQMYEESDWKKITACIVGKTDVQCFQRWQKVLNPNLVKGYWTKEEDEKLTELVEMFGTKRWAAVARSIPGRIGKQCRERWYNHLDPSIKKGAWTKEEERILARSHLKLGNKWAVISKLLPGRSENAVKNHWNTSLKRKAARKSSEEEEAESVSLSEELPEMSSSSDYFTDFELT